jgi:hypothetical protein
MYQLYSVLGGYIARIRGNIGREQMFRVKKYQPLLGGKICWLLMYICTVLGEIYKIPCSLQYPPLIIVGGFRQLSLSTQPDLCRQIYCMTLGIYKMYIKLCRM